MLLPEKRVMSRFSKFLENKNRDAALKGWFGQSKVVDANGNPKQVYHGTPKPFFNVFMANPDRMSHETGSLGFWFTDNPETAASFTEPGEGKEEYEYYTTGQKWSDGELMQFRRQIPSNPGIYPVFLKLEKPKIYSGQDGFEEMMDDRDEFVEYISGAKKKRGYWKHRYVAMNSKDANKEFRDYLISIGHDGIIMANTAWDAPGEERITQYVAFHPNQIKSVFSKGFDPDKPEISEHDVVTI